MFVDQPDDRSRRGERHAADRAGRRGRDVRRDHAGDRDRDRLRGVRRRHGGRADPADAVRAGWTDVAGVHRGRGGERDRPRRGTIRTGAICRSRLEATAARSGPRRRGRSGSSCWPAASSASGQGTTRCVRSARRRRGRHPRPRACLRAAPAASRPASASRVDRRPVAVALFVGFIVGYAQTAPLVQLPIYFQIALGYGPILAVVATIPFMAALVVAGPVAGHPASAGSSRGRIVVGGVAAVGAGNILAALVLGPRTPLPRASAWRCC